MNLLSQFIAAFFGLAIIAIVNKLWSSIYDVLLKERFESWLLKRKEQVKVQGKNILENNKIFKVQPPFI